GLEDETAPRAPIVMERQYELLKGGRRAGQCVLFAGATIGSALAHRMRPVKETERNEGVTIWTRMKVAAGRLFKAAAAAALTVSIAHAQATPRAEDAPRVRPQPTTPASVTRIARPALWRVPQGEATIHLFGTLHALPANLHLPTPAPARSTADARLPV